MPVNKKLHLNTLKKQWKHHRKTHRLVFVAFCVNPPSWSPIIFLLQVTHFAVLLKQEVRGSHKRGLTWGGHVSEILWPSNSGGDISIWNKMTDRQTRHLSGSILLTSTFIFISLTDTQCTDEMNRSTNAGMLMNAEVSGRRREGEEWGREQRGTIHTHGSS